MEVGADVELRDLDLHFQKQRMSPTDLTRLSLPAARHGDGSRSSFNCAQSKAKLKRADKRFSIVLL